MDAESSHHSPSESEMSSKDLNKSSETIEEAIDIEIRQPTQTFLDLENLQNLPEASSLDLPLFTPNKRDFSGSEASIVGNKEFANNSDLKSASEDEIAVSKKGEMIEEKATVAEIENRTSLETAPPEISLTRTEVSFFSKNKQQSNNLGHFSQLRSCEDQKRHFHIFSRIRAKMMKLRWIPRRLISFRTRR